MDTNFLMLGALAIGLVMVGFGCYLWRRDYSRNASAHLTRDGFQVVEVQVRDGYHPAKICLQAGQPTRLVFRRDEDDPCSAGIYLTEPPIQRHLPAFAATTITFTPEKSGNHLFTCDEGRHRGYLIVKPSSRSRPPSHGLTDGRKSDARLHPSEDPPTAPHKITTFRLKREP